MTLIWLTRGKSWGFRFLRDGGFEDPLPEYERVFREVPDGSPAMASSRHVIGVRFPDPDRRQDAAGRLITHEVVIYPPFSDGITTVRDAVARVWPIISAEYAERWDRADS